MANTYPIQFKRSSISGKIPSANSLSVGELALNFPDRIIYSKDATGNVISFADISIDAFYQANSAHDKINIAFVQANSAHSQSNLAFDKINVAFTKANTAHDKINVAFVQSNTGYNQANLAFAQANAAYSHSNLSIVLGNTILTLGSVNISITGLNSISSNNINSNTIILNENTIFCNTVTFTSNTTSQNLDSFLISQYRSCKYLIQVQFEDNYLTENGQGVITEDGIDILNQRLYQVSEILLLHDNDESYITEYGYMSTGNTLATFSTMVSGNKILLQVLPTFINTTIKYTRSTIA